MPSCLAMSSWKWFLLSFFGGGIVFWIPDLVIPALDRTEQRGAVTFACPALLVLCYMILRRLRKPERLAFHCDFFHFGHVGIGTDIHRASAGHSVRKL